MKRAALRGVPFPSSRPTPLGSTPTPWMPPLLYAQRIFLWRQKSVGFGVSYASFVIPNGFGHKAVVSQSIIVCGSAEQFLTINFLLLGESEGCSLPKR